MLFRNHSEAHFDVLGQNFQVKVYVFVSEARILLSNLVFSHKFLALFSRHLRYVILEYLFDLLLRGEHLFPLIVLLDPPHLLVVLPGGAFAKHRLHLSHLVFVAFLGVYSLLNVNSVLEYLGFVR